MLKAILVNHNHDPKDWWLDYGFKPEDVTVYDRSDDGIERTFSATTYETENIGDVDYDKLSFLVERYDDLPDVFLWGKTNIFKSVSPEYLTSRIDRADFAPLLKTDHKTYSDANGVVCRYSGGMYEERADSWYFNNPALSAKVKSWNQWIHMFALPSVDFIPFAPGGNYILTRERVHRYARDFYEKMRDTLPYAMHPAEAHACERSYYLLWR